MSELFLGPFLGAVGAIAFFLLFVRLAGFGEDGIIEGSLAALIHRFIGNIEAGGLFAKLQSIGTTGLRGKDMLIIGSIGAYYGWCMLGTDTTDGPSE